jgi:hypothetical protein
MSAPSLETARGGAALGLAPLAAASVAPPAAAAAAGERLLLGMAMLLCAGLAAAIYLPAEEDAFIYYRYALNWARGLGLAFNPGDPVEGYSSPIWMCLVGLLARLGCDLPLAVPALGIGCAAATVAATRGLARQVGLSRFGRLAAAFGVAISYPFLLWARSGLETPLYALLLVAAAHLYLAAEYPAPDEQSGSAAATASGRQRRQLRRRRLRLAGGAVLGLVSLARPEGMLLIAVVAVDRMLDRRDWRGAAWYVLPAAAGYGAYLMWRLATFGSLLPSTSVKLYPLLAGRSIRQIWAYLLLLGALPPLLPALALLRGMARGVERRRLAFLIAMVAVQSVLFQLLAGGDYRTGSRFLVPTLPVLLVTIWWSAERLEVERPRALRGTPARDPLEPAAALRGEPISHPSEPAARRPLASPAGRLALLGLLAGASVEGLIWNLPAVRELPQLDRQWRRPFDDRADWRVPIAHWVVEHVPDGGVVAFGQMGKVPYLAAVTGRDIVFLDTLGLLDTEVGRIYRLDRKLADLARRLAAGGSFAQALAQGRRERAARFAGILLARQPDVIIVETYLADYHSTENLLRRPAFARYTLVAEIPAGGSGPHAVRIFALAHPPS